MVTIQPHKIDVPQEVLDDLRWRLEHTRWPGEIAGAGWGRGVSLAFMKDLVAYWLDGYDWRREEAQLNAFAHFKAEVDGVGLHFVQQEGKGPKPLPLFMMHGYPWSFTASRITTRGSCSQASASRCRRPSPPIRTKSCPSSASAPRNTTIWSASPSFPKAAILPSTNGQKRWPAICASSLGRCACLSTEEEKDDTRHDHSNYLLGLPGVDHLVAADFQRALAPGSREKLRWRWGV